MPAPRTALAAALMLLGLAGARAEDADPTWYTVEVVMFAHLGEAGLDAELWPFDPGAPVLDGALELEPVASFPGPAPAPPAADARAGFVALPADELQLTDAARQLARSGSYRPLLHVAWRQPGLERPDARPVHLHDRLLANPFRRADDERLAPAPRLDGTLVLSRARYLHVEADLVYHRALPPPPVAAPVVAGSAAADAAGTAQVMLAPAMPTAFRMQQRRRMRSGELHYLDHPLFGVLVSVTPWAPPPPEPAPETPPVAAPADAPAAPAPAGAVTPPASPAR